MADEMDGARAGAENIDGDGDEADENIETVIEPNRDRPAQRKKVKRNGWNKARRKAFLTTLATTCNVSSAIAASGKSSSSAYRLRQRNAEFAAQWQAALTVGYERLETALLRRALEVADGFAVADEQETVARMTVAQAIELLDKHRRSVVAGEAKSVRAGAGRRPSQAETDKTLLKRIAVLQRQRAGAV